MPFAFLGESAEAPRVATDTTRRARLADRSARALLGFVALVGGITPWIADYNETHIFNPRWPPHAVFHDGQVLAATSLASAVALYFLNRRRGDRWSNFLAAFWLAALYWISLAAAGLFPNAAWLDPEFRSDASQYIAGIPGNAFACIVASLLLGAAFAAGWRAFRDAA